MKLKKRNLNMIVCLIKTASPSRIEQAGLVVKSGGVSAEGNALASPLIPIQKKRRRKRGMSRGREG